MELILKWQLVRKRLLMSSRRLSCWKCYALDGHVKKTEGLEGCSDSVCWQRQLTADVDSLSMSCALYFLYRSAHDIYSTTWLRHE